MLPPVTAERQTYCSPVYISNGQLVGFTTSHYGPRASQRDRKIMSGTRLDFLRSVLKEL